MLYICATPIGNLQDISLRALSIFASVDILLCEDTRTSSTLLKAHGIYAKRLISMHEHNEAEIADKVITWLQEGLNICQISDAGTPGISDPAFLLVRACVQRDIRVECLPGATAFVPALVNSGLPINRFCFEGFLPPKKGRQTLFTQLSVEKRTIAFYESPVRLVKTLAECITYFGADRPCSVSRELSKKFEENKRGTLQEVHDYFKEKGVKGEIVVVIEGS